MSAEVQQRIANLLSAHRIVLFMKGLPNAPRCGFSAKAAGTLNALGVDYHSVDVLADPDIREGIKQYGNWPTIPQLYVNGELLGGSDILETMLNSGELHDVLGLARPERRVPSVHVTDAAAAAISRAMADAEPGLVLHLRIDANYEARFELRESSGGEIVAEANGIRLHFDLLSASRAEGLEIDWVEDLRGAGLSIRNPNAPPAVKSIDVHSLKARLAAGDITVLDVRPQQDRALAPFPAAHRVLDQNSLAELAALPKDRALAFLCHHGNSSRQVAEHFRALGFTEVYNVEGGIDAWAAQIDPSVPRY